MIVIPRAQTPTVHHNSHSTCRYHQRRMPTLPRLSFQSNSNEYEQSIIVCVQCLQFRNLKKRLQGSRYCQSSFERKLKSCISQVIWLYTMSTGRVSWQSNTIKQQITRENRYSNSAIRISSTVIIRRWLRYLSAFYPCTTTVLYLHGRAISTVQCKFSYTYTTPYRYATRLLCHSMIMT